MTPTPEQIAEWKHDAEINEYRVNPLAYSDRTILSLIDALEASQKRAEEAERALQKIRILIFANGDSENHVKDLIECRELIDAALRLTEPKSAKEGAAREAI